MSFSGYLVKLKTGSNYVDLPMTYMGSESYTVTPHQRMESKASRNVDGNLSRTTCKHTASKIEFETPDGMTNKQISALNTLLKNAFTDNLKRDITIKYYDPENDTYKEADCYMPDVHYPILRIDGNTIWYKSIRYAFIEY